MIDYLSTFNQINSIFAQILLHEQKVDQLGHFYTAFHYLGKFLYAHESWHERGRILSIKPLSGCFPAHDFFGPSPFAILLYGNETNTQKQTFGGGAIRCNG